MSLVVELLLESEFGVDAGRDAVFAVLADVPRSAGHYPDVDALEDLGNGRYLWKLAELGIAGLRHAVVYACAYASDARAGTVSWTPIADLGNAQVAGRWQLRSARSGTMIGFRTQVTLQLPGPGIMRPVIAPFVEHSFHEQIRRYHRNLQQTFSGNRSVSPDRAAGS